MTKKTALRLERLRELWEKYGIDTQSERYSGSTARSLEERIHDKGEELERYLCVTSTGTEHYMHRVFDTIAEAKVQALAHIDDQDGMEFPVRIYDLDSKKSWYPAWSTIAWLPNQKEG